MRAACLAVIACLGCVATWANDFPTNARVEFVTQCMRDHPQSSEREAIYKCSCAVDAIAARMTYDEWVDASTVANAITIAGERGGVVRDMKDGRKVAASWRQVQEEARKGCFISE